jgi:uncharacterized protein with ATP-grasp and redox domains
VRLPLFPFTARASQRGKKAVNTYLDCIPCFLRQGIDAARYVTDDHRVHEQIVREILRLAVDLDFKRPPPWVGQLIHRKLRELTGVNDPYREAKSQFNRFAMKILPELRSLVNRDTERLFAATQIVVAANVIDLGVNSALSEDQAYRTLCNAHSTSLAGEWERFREQANGAKRILYLADNAGEIAIDRLLMEQLGPQRVTLAVRGKAVINDATLDDAYAVGLHEIVEVIDNGSDAPGTILDDCSDAFQKRFHEADLIIAKGQGNFETLSEIDANIFFLLKVKCPVIAGHIGLSTGTHAVISSKSRELTNNAAQQSQS